jgi:hypothetical protein
LNEEDKVKGVMLPLAVVVLLFLLAAFVVASVNAEDSFPPQPPTLGTLGPVVFSAISSGSIAIYSPKDGVMYVNPVLLRFSVEVDGVFGQFGNVGVSVDGGVVMSITDFESKSSRQIEPYWYTTRTLAAAHVALPTLPEGEHNATVYYGWQYLGIPENPSLERYEVYAHATVTFVIRNIDTTAPSISIESPQNKTYDTANVTLNVTLNEAASQIFYVLDGEEGFPFEGNMTLTGLPNGEHNVTVYATDLAGNAGASETVYFTVKVPDPFPTLPVALAIVAAVVVAAGLLVYFRRRR